MTLHEIEAAIRQIDEVFDASDAPCVGGFVDGIYVLRILEARNPADPLSLPRDRWIVWSRDLAGPCTLPARMSGDVRHVAEAVMMEAE